MYNDFFKNEQKPGHPHVVFFVFSFLFYALDTGTHARKHIDARI